MHIQPQSARFYAETTTDGLRAVVPASRNWLTMLFLLVWLGAWVAGETSAIDQLLNAKDGAPPAFLLFWLAGWTLGGIFAFTSLAWQLAGREILTANALALTHRVEIFGVGISRTYQASDIKDLRTTESSGSPALNRWATFPPFFGSAHGLIAFDYGARTIRLGVSLDEAEAKMLVSSLVSHLPRHRFQA